MRSGLNFRRPPTAIDSSKLCQRELHLLTVKSLLITFPIKRHTVKQLFIPHQKMGCRESSQHFESHRLHFSSLKNRH